MVPERTESARVRGHGVVSEVARDHRPQPLALFDSRVVHAVTQLCLDLPELRSHAVAPSLAPELERPAPGLATDEHEPKEVRGLRFTKPSALAPTRDATSPGPRQSD